MPRFFFHLTGPQICERDEDGVVFDSLENAYLDAYRAVIDISFDMLRDRRDPSRCCFEICDADGRRVLELPFAEVLRPASTSPPTLLAARALGRSRQRNTELNGLISTQIAEAHATLQVVRATMERPNGHKG